MKPKEPHVIAHRGGRRWAPENTMAAFRKSLDAAVWGIELDIHRASSGELVVIHDDDVKRTTNGVGLVKNISYPELKRLSAGLWFSPEFRDERVPLLAEVLDLVDGKAVLNIEIKNCPVDYPGIEDDLLELLKDYRYCDKLIISSFDHQVVRRVHAKAPDLKTAVLADAILVDLKSYAEKLGATVWHPCFDSLRADAVSEAHEAGIEVNAWTVNDPNSWSECLAMGLDGIITDDPLGLAAFLDKVAKVSNRT